jgi:hypothetical protein
MCCQMFVFLLYLFWSHDPTARRTCLRAAGKTDTHTNTLLQREREREREREGGEAAHRGRGGAGPVCAPFALAHVAGLSHMHTQNLFRLSCLFPMSSFCSDLHKDSLTCMLACVYMHMKPDLGSMLACVMRGTEDAQENPTDFRDARVYLFWLHNPVLPPYALKALRKPIARVACKCACNTSWTSSPR